MEDFLLCLETGSYYSPGQPGTCEADWAGLEFWLTHSSASGAVITRYQAEVTATTFFLL